METNGNPKEAKKTVNGHEEKVSFKTKLWLFMTKIIEWIKKYWLRYSLVLVIPMILILCSSLLSSLKIETFLFVAAGISNLIALVDINRELCKETKKGKEAKFGVLFSQLIILAFIIALSFSLIFVDYDVESNIIFPILGIILLLVGTFFLLRRNVTLGNYLVFLGIVAIAIYIWVDINKMKSEELGAYIHLLVLPLFFFGFDGYRVWVLKATGLKEFLKLDFGLVVVGIITFTTGHISREPLYYFEAGSAAAILIIGNYFYLLLTMTENRTS